MEQDDEPIEPGRKTRVRVRKRRQRSASTYFVPRAALGFGVGWLVLVLLAGAVLGVMTMASSALPGGVPPALAALVGLPSTAFLAFVGIGLPAWCAFGFVAYHWRTEGPGAGRGRGWKVWRDGGLVAGAAVALVGLIAWGLMLLEQAPR